MKLIHGVLIHGVLILLVLLLVMFTMSLSKSQDSSSHAQTKSDTDSKAVPALKLNPALKKVSDAQKDTISILLDRIKEPTATGVEKTNKNMKTASTLLNSSNKTLSKVIDIMVPRTTKFNKLYLIEVEPFYPTRTTEIRIDSMSVPEVVTPEPSKTPFFKRIFHK